MKGFIGWVGATIGDRMMTITAWKTSQIRARPALTHEKCGEGSRGRVV